jgi:hypothetical protein
VPRHVQATPRSSMDHDAVRTGLQQLIAFVDTVAIEAAAP